MHCHENSTDALTRCPGSPRTVRQGLFEVVPHKYFAVFSPRELGTLIAGESDIDVDDWEAHTIYKSGFKSDSREVRWFWELMREFTNLQLQHLLEFATGSAWVPAGGFKNLQGRAGETHKFVLNKTHYTEYNILPLAHTCFNRLDFPDYPSKEEMKRYLTLVTELDARHMEFGIE